MSLEGLALVRSPSDSTCVFRELEEQLMFQSFRTVYATFSFFSCVVSCGLQINAVQLTTEMNRPDEHIFEPKQRNYQ
jgi:hypothetical protein